jgi:hypothetical protein
MIILGGTLFEALFFVASCRGASAAIVNHLIAWVDENAMHLTPLRFDRGIVRSRLVLVLHVARLACDDCGAMLGTCKVTNTRGAEWFVIGRDVSTCAPLVESYVHDLSLRRLVRLVMTLCAGRSGRADSCTRQSQ